jgi:hypothetical protein
MAFTQKPGRSPFLKTGNGLPSVLMQVDPTQKAKELEDKAKKAVASYKSNKKLNTSELAIETAAAKDSITAAQKNMSLLDKDKRQVIGNQAANKTRALNFAGTTVEKSEIIDKKTGPKTVYKRK